MLCTRARPIALERALLLYCLGLPISPKDDLIPFHRPPLLECKERSNTFTESRIMEDLLGIIGCEFHCIACRDAYRLDELPTLCLHWKNPFLSPAPRSIFEVGTLGEGKSW